jgi:hypothetical protein
MTQKPNGTRGIQPEMLVGVSAVVIGVCALGVSLYEASLMREQQRAAVLPILELGRSFYLTPEDEGTEKWRLSFSAENVGIGPARIVDFVVTVDGKPQATWGEAIRTMLDRKGEVRYGQSTINGRTIPPDRSITIFELADRSLAPDIMQRFERLDFSACYCSVFDECWTTSYSTFGAPSAVASCRRTENSFKE